MTRSSISRTSGGPVASGLALGRTKRAMLLSLGFPWKLGQQQQLGVNVLKSGEPIHQRGTI